MNLLKKISWIVLGSLVIYSAIILIVDYVCPAGCVRYFLTDIADCSTPYCFLPCYAVNTTLSVFFLWAGAVLFLMSWRCLGQDEHGGKEEAFLISQMLMFVYLGCDDRFLIHEGLSDALGMKDCLLFGFLGLLEVFFLLYFGRIFSRSRKVLIDVFFAGLFFSSMCFIDIVVPYSIKLHLGLEDLSKLWSAVFLFKFAWDTCAEKIDLLKKGVPLENS